MREINYYNIGLDIGTNSVGWAVTNENGHMLKHKGKNMWGVRLFEKGDTAAVRRVYRSTRRRISRRKQRLNHLQEIFAMEISQIDKNFFIRLQESFLHKEDSSILSPTILFNDKTYTDKEYYKEYPTIYHLRKALIDQKQKADIRLIYLSMHHILKYRGNFLYGKVDFGDINKSIDELLEYLFLNLFIDEESESLDVDFNEIKMILSSNCKKGDKQEALQKLLLGNDKNLNNKIKEFIKAVLGYKFSLIKLFELEDTKDVKNRSFKEEMEEEEIEQLLGEYIELFNSIKNIYNWVVVEELLGDIDSDDPSNKTISNAMITKHDKHKRELKMLKRLIKDVCPEEYNNIFRREEQNHNYLNYIKYTNKNTLEDLNKYIKKILDKYPKATNHNYYKDIYRELCENKLLSKLNTTDNSTIPYQLQKVEMERIINNQGEYYPFLLEKKTLLMDMLESTIQYYVGPLNRKSEFAWNIPLTNGVENEKMYPWNYEKFIDIDKTAEEFIKRMTNKCSYLTEEDVIPRYSLLYCEFILLNELNKIRINGRLIDQHIKKSIINDLFKIKKNIRRIDLIQWIKNNPNGFITSVSDEIIIEGMQGENEFAASLSSYCDLYKIFGKINDSNINMIEEIISWITIFEDKIILKRKIKEKYGIDKTKMEQILKLNYSGWARLSKKLIDGISVQKNSKWSGNTIMDIMRNSNYNFMQIINNSRLGFREIIDILNPSIGKEKIDYTDIKNLQGSPAIKRGIWETVKIIEEIVAIMGNEPQNIYMEFARSDEKSKRTVSRVNRMKTVYDRLKEDVVLYNKDAYEALQNSIRSGNKLDHKALYLYFSQNGKCMYTGKPLDPEELNKYEIDHIIPRSYIKDDSLDNLVLVIPKSNQDKKDRLGIGSSIKSQQREYWNNLYKYGLISKRKLQNLEENITETDIAGFINRQLVETRQISKHVSDILSEVYKDTNIMAIKAKLVSDYRKQYYFYKNRNVNDYHHAHDALITSVIGNFIINRFPYLEDEVNIKKYIAWFKNNNEDRNNKNKYGFILSSMNKDYTNGIFTWNKDDEITRMKKALAYKDCFTTKKVEKQSGKFYKETIYGAKTPDAKIPLKKGLDPKKYGGYTGEQNAYYVVIEYSKGSKKVKKLVGIPIDISKRNLQNSIRDYLIGIEKIENVNSLIILKDNIKRYQLLEYKGQEIYLVSDTEIINAVQLIVDKKFDELLFKIEEGERTGERIIDNSYNEIISSFVEHYVLKLETHYPLYDSIKTRIIQSKDDFEKLDLDMKVEFVRELLRLTQAKPTTGNFNKFKTPIKGERTGRLQNRSKKGWDLNEIIFIDKSITGLFERRYKI